MTLSDSISEKDKHDDKYVRMLDRFINQAAAAGDINKLRALKSPFSLWWLCNKTGAHYVVNWAGELPGMGLKM